VREERSGPKHHLTLEDVQAFARSHARRFGCLPATVSDPDVEETGQLFFLIIETFVPAKASVDPVSDEPLE
jgi:hypothetical protein